MDLIKEYKWWILLVIILFISLYFATYFVNKNKENDNENIISNWEERQGEIRELVSFYKLKGIPKLSEEENKKLQDKLWKAHCGSVSKVGDYFKIEYKNDDIKGILFYYNIFDRPVADSMLKVSNWVPCIYHYFKPDVVLEMHGGVLGAECWNDYLKNLDN